MSDVVKNVQLRVGDRVRFCIAKDSQSGTCYACQIMLIESVSNLANHSNNNSNSNSAMTRQRATPESTPPPPPEPPRVYRGIISVLRDTFGKIEREDAYKETFFHFAEYKDTSQAPQIGLNVEFEIETRHGKEMAANIRALAAGTVNFDELSPQYFLGRIIKAPMTTGNVPATGLLIYECDDKLVELSFTDKDHVPGAGAYTLLEGDFIHFRIAADKRLLKPTASSMSASGGSGGAGRPSMTGAGKQRATHLTLIESYSMRDNAVNTSEHRENGLLMELDAASGSGLIKCVERDELVFFNANELIRYATFVPTEAQQGTQQVIN